MKRFLLIFTTLLALAVQAAETSTLTIAVNVSGTLSADDRRGALWLIKDFNASQTNVVLSVTNGAVIKSSYEYILSNKLAAAHLSYLKDAKSAAATKQLIADEDVYNRITAAVIDALTDGQTIEQIISAIKKLSP
mgnify:FL=1